MRAGANVDIDAGDIGDLDIDDTLVILVFSNDTVLVILIFSIDNVLVILVLSIDIVLVTFVFKIDIDAGDISV